MGNRIFFGIGNFILKSNPKLDSVKNTPRRNTIYYSILRQDESVLDKPPVQMKVAQADYG